jgi:hypothetical protein
MRTFRLLILTTVATCLLVGIASTEINLGNLNRLGRGIASPLSNHHVCYGHNGLALAATQSIGIGGAVHPLVNARLIRHVKYDYSSVNCQAICGRFYKTPINSAVVDIKNKLLRPINKAGMHSGGILASMEDDGPASIVPCAPGRDIADAFISNDISQVLGDHIITAFTEKRIEFVFRCHHIGGGNVSNIFYNSRKDDRQLPWATILANRSNNGDFEPRPLLSQEGDTTQLHLLASEPRITNYNERADNSNSRSCPIMVIYGLAAYLALIAYGIFSYRTTRQNSDFLHFSSVFTLSSQGR